MEALQAEQLQIMPTAAGLCQVSHDLPHDTTELEAMTGKSGGDADLWQLWVQVEDEMLVWRIGKEASFQRHRWPRGFGKIAGREAT